MTWAAHLRRLAAGPAGLVAAFLAVHLLLGLASLSPHPPPSDQPAGDVSGVYRAWLGAWHAGRGLVGVDLDWVYPIGALAPILAAEVGGAAGYLDAWLLLVSVLDGIALMLLARRRRSLAWWWLLLTLALGPVALVRLDSVAAPLAVVGVLAVARRPAAASALLTAAAWVKVWPAALVVALLVAGRRRARAAAAAALVTVGVVAVALAVGAGAHLLSFVRAQAGRGLQIEAPIAGAWLWSALLGTDGSAVYFDLDLLTWQVRGSGVTETAALMTPLLALVVGGTLVLALVALRRGAASAPVVALTALALVAATIVLNKVGSPQYLIWLVAPLLLGLLTDPRRFRRLAAVAVVAAALTQVVYPWWYLELLSLNPVLLTVLTARNALEAVLLVVPLSALIGLAGTSAETTRAAPPGADRPSIDA